jgi:uncharacterized peroxidase-related enzyme
METIVGTGIPVIEEEEATGEVADIYAEVKRFMQMPVVPNLVKSLSSSPAVMHSHWTSYREFLSRTILPPSLAGMILYAVAQSNHCEYCSAINEMSCRSYGIDEETLGAMVNDLDSVNPERLRAILEFVVKAVHYPHEVTRADYDGLRGNGLTDEEIIEVLYLGSISVLNNILSDAMKMEVDPMVKQALGRAA